MHFLWGLNIFLIFSLFFKWKPLHSICGVFLWQMLWEVIEMIGDKLTGQPAHMADHMFFDGIIDTIVDLLGAILGWLILRTIVGKESESNNSAPFMTWISYYSILLIPLFIVGSIIYFKTQVSPDILTSIWIVVAYPAALLISKLRK
jgi:hypothetical protein